MHALSHSLAHRAPPATRTKVRWQPYSSLPSSSTTTTTSPASTYLNTPASSVTTSPTSILSHEFKRSRQPTPKPVSQQIKNITPRDALKNKYALGLVDEAVKSLCEIWRPQDIPPVYSVSFKLTPNTNCPPDINDSRSCPPQHRSNPQLPSPLLPRSPPSLWRPTANLTPRCIEVAPQLQPRNNQLPIKGFVHEVLRRSRTSGCVLQTALCYLEAIRPKVPQLILKEKVGELEGKESNLGDKLVSGAQVELAQIEGGVNLDAIINTDECDAYPFTSTIMVTDESCGLEESGDPAFQWDSDKSRQSGSAPPTAPLPSPLLCPRRSFLAALILASKFTQDKCYSNRAWAKLSGLSPKEIGRCERALGEALDWRLWVGKLPVASQTPTVSPVVTAHRPIHRARSESSLLTLPSMQSPFLVRSDSSLPRTSDRSLRRSSTLPANALMSEQKPDISGGSCSASRDCFDVLQPVPVEEPTPPITLEDIMDESPSSQSSTPPLIYSPSSTESSSVGGKTVPLLSGQESIEGAHTKSITRAVFPEPFSGASSMHVSWPCLDTFDDPSMKSSQGLAYTSKSSFLTASSATVKKTEAAIAIHSEFSDAMMDRAPCSWRLELSPSVVVIQM
ncbi:hypothetical protein AX17_001405 [Amanita inopinata Kibby_2008]|nr:hypothetical protein AX17_001405 [Amanita inopinata Kibby_2008]